MTIGSFELIDSENSFPRDIINPFYSPYVHIKYPVCFLILNTLPYKNHNFKTACSFFTFFRSNRRMLTSASPLSVKVSMACKDTRVRVREKPVLRVPLEPSRERTFAMCRTAAHGFSLLCVFVAFLYGCR